MRCLITNEPWEGSGPYSTAGLRVLDRRLKSLAPLPYTREQLLEEAAARAVKMSIQGVQPKVSTALRATEGRMEIVDHGGRYIVKPPHLIHAELPENEALTMSLAATLGIEVPVHGLLLNGDQTRSYFVRRFDRVGWNKQPVEDFAQLSGASRDTKYDSSTERLIEIIDRFCTFPALERMKFLDRLLCAFLTGNEDMHLKNWSLITRDDKVELSPAYDLLNSTIPNPKSREELALPLRGKKSNLRENDFWRYLAGERLGLGSALIEQTQARFAHACADWPARIESSFLSAGMKMRYLALLAERRERLGGV
ncbi:MAG: HipA domain-containing protein [Verrucomicrobia bacterium]|nr:HipA domain-containing protein [Verrucomicrobiota bacterium]